MHHMHNIHIIRVHGTNPSTQFLCRIRCTFNFIWIKFRIGDEFTSYFFHSFNGNIVLKEEKPSLEYFFNIDKTAAQIDKVF